MGLRSVVFGSKQRAMDKEREEEKLSAGEKAELHAADVDLEMETLDLGKAMKELRKDARYRDIARRMLRPQEEELHLMNLLNKTSEC